MTKTIFQHALWRVALGLLGVAAVALTDAAEAQKLVSASSYNVAIKGYDPVAYLAEGRAVEGRSEFEFAWRDAKWRFLNGANRDAISGDPERYAPQYGGFCALSVAHNESSDGDPESWTITDGKVYLNANKTVQRRWLKDMRWYIGAADANWARRLGKN
ncbi:MAG: YHS domain-containing (seleno)protein [Alphaproteobacteria bacterium]